MSFGPACGPFVSELLRRVRDPQGAIHSRAFARDILSRCQQIVNAYKQLIIVTEPVATLPLQQVYQLRAVLPKASSVVGIYEKGNPLTDAGNFIDLAHADPRWFRRTGDRFDSFARCGDDIFIVTPGKEVASTIYVNYVKLTEPLTNDGVSFDFRDHDLPVVMALAEAVLLLRNRDFGSLDTIIKHVLTDLGMEATVAKS